MTLPSLVVLWAVLLECYVPPYLSGIDSHVLFPAEPLMMSQCGKRRPFANLFLVER